MEFSDLPALNASLNTATAVCLILGLIFIKNGKVGFHKTCIVFALGFSVAFFVSYLTYHFKAGTTRFLGEGWVRPVYFTILLSHTILAATVPPMAIVTVAKALKGRTEQHRKIARWTLPIWLYVSITGVLIYGMLYHLYPHPTDFRP